MMRDMRLVQYIILSFCVASLMLLFISSWQIRQFAIRREISQERHFRAEMGAEKRTRLKLEELRMEIKQIEESCSGKQ